MYLGNELGVVDRYRLAEFGLLPQIDAVALPQGRGGRVVLETADNVEYRVLGKHHLEQCVLVEQENVLEYVVEVVQALEVLEVLAHVEQVEQLADVVLGLDRHCQLVLFGRQAQAIVEQLADVLQAADLAARQFDRQRIRHLVEPFIFRLFHNVLSYLDRRIFTLNLFPKHRQKKLVTAT